MRPRLMTLSCVLAVLVSLPALALEDFTFVHVSDIHYPYGAKESAATIAAIPRQPFVWPGTQETVPAPAFLLATGDLNEFGGGRGNWDGVMKLLGASGLPVHVQLGNHDNTWDCGRPRLRALEGSPFYAFQYGGATFIGFDTATPQDPRPSIATEGLLWLQQELQNTPAGQPVFFFCHHPLNTTEFASTYDRDRLIEVLQRHNVVLLLVGHGHSAVKQAYEGLDAVMGGNTYSDSRGFSLISVKGGRVRVMHHFLARQPQDVILLDKAIPATTRFQTKLRAYLASEKRELSPPIRVLTRQDEGDGPFHWTFDNKQQADQATAGDLDVPGEIAPGAHWARVQGSGDHPGLAVTTYWVTGGPLRLRWRAAIPAQCQGSPALLDDRIYVGANDGKLYCFAARTGAGLWAKPVGGEVRGTPLVLSDGRVCVAGSDGTVACFTADGTQSWRASAGAAVYASLAAAAGQVLCACTDGVIAALSPADGHQAWRRQTAGYCFETGPAVAGDTAYAGSWDRYLYALAVGDGTTRWRALSKGSDRPNAPEYYSPADAPPVCAGGRVYVADRGYNLSVYEAGTGKMLSSEGKCASVAAGAGGTVYVRHSDGRLTKLGADGAVVWTVAVPTGYVPSQPVEADGRVWVVSSLGTLSALDAATGALQAQGRVSPELFVFGGPAARGSEAYVVDAGGNLVAVEVP